MVALVKLLMSHPFVKLDHTVLVWWQYSCKNYAHVFVVRFHGYFYGFWAVVSIVVEGRLSSVGYGIIGELIVYDKKDRFELGESVVAIDH